MSYIASNSTDMVKDKKKQMTTVRIDRELHSEIKELADKEGKLLERVVQDLLKKGLEATEK